MPGRLTSLYLHLPGQFDGRLHRFGATAEELGNATRHYRISGGDER